MSLTTEETAVLSRLGSQATNLKNVFASLVPAAIIAILVVVIILGGSA